MKTTFEENRLAKYPLDIGHYGTADYREILELQHELQEKRRSDEIPNTVIIVEHPAVITLGARKSANMLLVSKEELAKRKIDVVEIRRGGGTTAHNPGQLVFYPILDLRQLKLGINEYIRKLEAIGIDLLRESGLESVARKGYPGLWIGERKIASIGVRVSKFVTCHGMAINIQNDLEIFDYIKPCGFNDIEMTSLFRETGEKTSMKLVKKRLSQLLMRYFS